MRKLILQEWITLNGYAADEKGTTSFFEKPELNERSDDDLYNFMDRIDTILLGANTYKMFVTYWPEAEKEEEIMADRLNATPKIVFSRSLTEAPWGKWESATIVAGDAAEEIKKLKSKPGKDMVLWGSISLAQSLIKANLIDEYQLRICPTFLSSGRALFNDIDNTDLQLVETKQYSSGLLFTRYVPATKS